MAKLNLDNYQISEIDPVTGLTGNDSKVNLKNIKLASEFSSPFYDINLPKEFGESKYDTGVTEEDLYNLNEVRARRQSTADKWANASLKFGITAATTFGDMIGTIVGAAEMLEDGKLSSAVDNSWTRAMLNIQEWSERELPNYYTKEELESPWYQNLGTANFWADKVLKNFGFAVGAFASAAVTGGLGASALGLNATRRALVNNVGKGLFSKAVAGKIDDVASKQIITALKTKGLSASDDVVKSIIQDGKKIKNLSLANQITAHVVGSMAEGRFEAGHAMKEFTENQKAILDTKLASGEINEQQYDLELQDVEEKAKSLGNRVFGLNLAVLSAGNFMQWSKALARGYDTQKDLMRGIKGSIKNQYKTTRPITKLGKIGDKALATTIGVKNALIEGNEEMMQRFISEGTKQHYEKEMSGESDAYINSLIGSLKETYGNIANWEEFVIGAFSGGIGIPTIQNGKFGMAGGIYGDIKAQANKDKRAQEVLTSLNKLINSNEFKNNYYAANFQSATEAEKVDALVKDNKFEFLNAEDLQLTNLVNTFYTAGKIEDLINWADGLKNAKADEIRGLLDVNKEVDENGKVKETTDIQNPLLNKTDQEIESYNSKRADAIKAKIEAVRDIREGVDAKFGDSVSIEGRQALSNLLASTPLIESRMEELEQIINDNLYSTDGRTIKEIANKANNLFRRYGKVVELSNKAKSARMLKGKVDKSLKEFEELQKEITILEETINYHKDKIKSLGAEGIVDDKIATKEKELEQKNLKNSQEKLSKLLSKKKEYQKRIDKFSKSYESKNNELDSLLQEEYNQRKKVSEQYNVLYKDLTFKEYSEEVSQLIDQIEDYDNAVKESYNKIGENPLNQDKIEKVQEAIKDMNKLAAMRNFAIESYLSAIESVQKDPNHFKKIREEAREDLKKRENQARINRVKKSAKNFTDGILMVDKEGNEVKVKDTDGKVRVLGKNKNGKFTVNLKLEVDEEFIENYKLPSEINKETSEEPFTGFEGFDPKETTNASGIYISKNKAGVTGILFNYKTTQKKQDGTEVEVQENYLAAPNGTFYKIYGEDGEQVLGTRKYTSMYFNKGTLLNSNKQLSVEFDGTVEVDKTTGTRYLVKYQSNPVLDNLIRNEEEYEDVKEEDLNSLNDLEAVDDPATEETSIISSDKEGNHKIDLERFATGNSGKVLLRTVVLNKKGDGWKEDDEAPVISDTESGREALENVISLYEAQTGRSLFQDLYNRRKLPPKEREGIFVMFGKNKVYYDLPKNVAKSIVLIPVKKGKGKKAGWGRPITITDPEIIKGFSIYKNDNGNYYTFYKGKYHLVKNQDYQGQYKMFDHWIYSYTILKKEGDVYNFKFFGKDSSIPLELIDSAIESGEFVENIDYVKTKEGIRLFRNLSYDEDLKQFEIKGRTSPVTVNNEDTGYTNIRINKVYKDISSDLSNLEKHDTKYTAIYNGNKIGIKRQGWKYPIIEGDNQFTLGKSSELTYRDKDNFKALSGEVGVVTEPSEGDKVWDPIPRIVLDKKNRNVLFATTFTEVSADLDNPKNIDNAPDNVKRYNLYLNRNKVDGKSHGIILVRGVDVGWDYTEKDLIIAVIGKKQGNEVKPVDIDGNVIELSEVFEKGIATTVPDPNRYTASPSTNQNVKGEAWTILDNNKKSEDKEITVASKFTTEKVVKAEIDSYVAFYEETLKELQDNPEGIATKIIRITEGKNLHRNSNEPVMLATEQALQQLLSDPENYEVFVGTTAESGKYNTILRNGYVYIEDKRNGNLYELQTNLLTDNQKQTVTEILKLFASNAKIELDGKVRFNSTAEVGGSPVDIIKEGLERIVYFQDRNNLKLEGVKRLKELNSKLSQLKELTRDAYLNLLEGVDTEALNKATGVELQVIKDEIKKIKEGSLPGYRINNNPKTQFYLADAPDNVNLPGGLIVIGENILPFLDQKALENGTSQINPDVLPILEEFLNNRRLNVNSSLLIKGGAFDFIRIKDNNLIVSSGDSYKEYVVSNTTTSTVEHQLNSEDSNSTLANVNKKIIFETTLKEPSADPGDFEGEDTGGMKRGTLTKENVEKGKAKIKASKYAALDKALGREKEASFLDESPEERAKKLQEIADKRKNKKDTPLDNSTEERPLDNLGFFRRKSLMTSKELEDFDKFSKWVIENLGYEFYNNFVSIDNTTIMEGRFGEFTDNIIKLYADAELGTGYHETFHAVRTLLLSDKEYERVVRQFTSDPRFKNRITQMEELYKDKSREDIIEEALAEEFREFVLTDGESLKKANAPVVKGIFKRILNWIKTLINPNTKDYVYELFSKINSGKYKNRTPRTNAPSKSMFRTKFGIKEFDKIEVHEDIMQGFTSLFFNKLFDPSFVKDGLYELFGKEPNSKLIGQLYSNIEKFIRTDVDYLKARNNDKYNYEIKVKEHILDNFGVYVGDHLSYLSKYNIEEVEEVNENDMVGRSESGSQYNYSSLKVSAKANSTGIIKALLGSLLSIDPQTRKAQLNNIGLPKQEPFGKVFSILINKLSGTTTIEEKYPILMEISQQVPEVRTLMNRLKIESYMDSNAVLSLNFRDMEILSKFNQTFSKNTNNFVLALIGAEGAYNSIDSNEQSFIFNVKNKWKSDFNTHSEYNKRVEKINGVNFYNPTYYKDYKNILSKTATSTDHIEFLNAVGIYITEDVFKKDHIKFSKILYKDIIKGTQPVIYSNSNTTDFSGRLDSFIKDATETAIDYIENSHRNFNGDLVYNNTVNSPISLVFNKLNQIRSENSGDISKIVAEEFPFLDMETNLYIRNSAILRDLFTNPNARISLNIHEGVRLEGEQKGLSFKDFSYPERLFTWFKEYKKGNHVLIRPSDNSIERFITLENIALLNIKDSEGFKNYDPITSLILYLEDELALASDRNNLKYLNFAKNRFNGIVMDMIKEEAELQEQSQIFEDLKTSVKSGTYIEFLNEYQSELEELLENYVQRKSKEASDTFKKYKITNKMLGIEKDSYDSEIRKFVLNHIASAIEQTKLITGSIVFSKDLGNMYKRNSGVANTKKVSWVGKRGESLENWIKNNLKRLDRQDHYNDEFWFKDHPVLNTIILNDVISGSKYSKEYEEILDERAEVYNKAEAGDGYSIAHIDEFRELLFRSGDWNEDLENLRTYEIKGYLKYLVESDTDSDWAKSQYKRLFKEDYDSWDGNLVKNSKSVINSLKPQYRGPLAVEGFVPSMYKTSLGPLLPSMFIDFNTMEVTRPNMLSLYKQMVDKGVGIVSFYSANKGMTTIINKEIPENTADEDVNSELLQETYSENGEVNSFEEYIVQPTYYSFWGIQLDTGFKEKNKVVYGTQMLKQLLNGVYEFGNIDPESPLAKKYEKFVELNNERISLGIQILQERLGLYIGDDGKWAYDDKVESLIDSLKKEAISRDMPENLIEQIDYLAPDKENKTIPLDAMVNSAKMKTILFSMADALTISQKAFGKASYQMPSLFFESDNSKIRRIKDKFGKDRIVSDELNFYGFNRDKSGNITGVKSMEVYLPSYLKGIVNTGEVDSKLLQLVGFRIPTQGLNSIESIVVKGFLSDSLGDVIVLPTEIVTKAGSDYDIDKLNIYIPNFYKNYKGKFVYLDDSITYNDYVKDNQTKLNYNIINKYTKDIVDENERNYIRRYIKASIRNVSDASGYFETEDLYREMLKDYNEVATLKNNEHVINFINYLVDVINNKQDDIDGVKMMSELEFKKKITENKLLNAMNEIITDKDNARQLLNPLDSDNFEKLIKELENINPLMDKKNLKNFSNYADPLFHSQVSMQYMEGAGAIGIAANSAIFQIHSSLNDFKLAFNFIHTLTKGDIDKNSGKYAKEKEAISTKINLPYNKDEDGKVALGGLKDANNDMFLYDVFNAYITLTVDNAKNNTLSYLNAGLKTLNTALYLAMAGVPYKHIHYFLRQPIIMKYMENMTIYESFFLKAEGIDKFPDEIADTTFKEFLGKSSEDFVKSNGYAIKEFTEKELKNMLTSEPRKDNLKEQHQILSDFLRYQKTAVKLNKAIQAMQYDTKSIGRNATDSMVLKTATDFMQESGFIENFDRAFDNNKSFISKYKEALEVVNNMLSPFSLVMNDPVVNTYFRSFIYKYFKDDPGFGLERIKDIIYTWESSLLSYIVLSKPNAKGLELHSLADRIFKGKYSIPKVINEIKNIIEEGNRNNGKVSSENQAVYDAFRNNSVIQYLTPIIDPNNPIDGLTLTYKGKDATESDKLTEDWRELVNGDVLYKGGNIGRLLAAFTLLQSGTQFSPISFTDLMPYELYISIIGDALQNEITVEDMRDFTVSFFIHNEISPDIVKYTTEKKIGKAEFNEQPLKVVSNLFPLVKTKTRLDRYKNKSEEEILDLIRKGKRPFKLKPDLYFSTTAKKLPDFGNLNNYKEGLSLLRYGNKKLKEFSEQFGYLFFPDYSSLKKTSVPVYKKTTTSLNNKINTTSENYTKNTANDKTKGFFFTENLQAYLANRGRLGEENLPGPKQGIKLDVTASNNQAGIRMNKGVRNLNAFAIISKKFQQNERGYFVKQEGQFKDTEEDFELFKKYNTEAIQEALDSELPLVISDKGIATGKSALPLRFVEWLNDKLENTLGISGTIRENTMEGYKGYGIFDIKEVSKTEDYIELKDGNFYSTSDINGAMLEAMGYKPKEIGSILKENVC